MKYYSNPCNVDAIVNYELDARDSFPGYSLTLADFRNFLIASGFRLDFSDDMENYLKDVVNEEWIATTYSIPVIMVKYFAKKITEVR